jgi:hypothetical protein
MTFGKRPNSGRPALISQWRHGTATKPLSGANSAPSSFSLALCGVPLAGAAIQKAALNASA